MIAPARRVSARVRRMNEAFFKVAMTRERRVSSTRGTQTKWSGGYLVRSSLKLRMFV